MGSVPYNPPIGSIYHLYTTYSPCQLGYYMVPIPPREPGNSIEVVLVVDITCRQFFHSPRIQGWPPSQVGGDPRGVKPMYFRPFIGAPCPSSYNDRLNVEPTIRAFLVFFSKTLKTEKWGKSQGGFRDFQGFFPIPSMGLV